MLLWSLYVKGFHSRGSNSGDSIGGGSGSNGSSNRHRQPVVLYDYR